MIQSNFDLFIRFEYVYLLQSLLCLVFQAHHAAVGYFSTGQKSVYQKAFDNAEAYPPSPSLVRSLIEPRERTTNPKTYQPVSLRPNGSTACRPERCQLIPYPLFSSLGRISIPKSYLREPHCVQTSGKYSPSAQRDSLEIDLDLKPESGLTTISFDPFCFAFPSRCRPTLSIGEVFGGRRR
jgi:hypothetical protein